ncbi:MAG: hypothetical protein Ct9H300mP31_17940 [Acidimicrobiaceae bacterium]|nr:MAG: hypothetical protein Ct9H300mP31_17940 [Acidimicrobiaceae bacterium]
MILLVVMALTSFGLRFTYRYLLFGTACRIETDLRPCSMDTYPAVVLVLRPGGRARGVISRANSDIRSIQLLLAFGPLGPGCR